MTLAQSSTSLGTIGGEGLGPFGNQVLTDKYVGATNLINTVSSLVGILTVAGTIWFLLQLVFGGYEWMSAGGDSKKIAGARDRITHAFIGLVIVVGSWSLLAVTGQFFGYDTLASPKSIIDNLGF